jgi:hypothetical protein
MCFGRDCQACTHAQSVSSGRVRRDTDRSQARHSLERRKPTSERAQIGHYRKMWTLLPRVLSLLHRSLERLTVHV